MFQQVGRLLLIVGLTAATVGGVLYTLGRFGVERLPGDITLSGRNWRIYLPLGTSIALSIILMLVMFLLAKFRK